MRYGIPFCRFPGYRRFFRQGEYCRGRRRPFPHKNFRCRTVKKKDKILPIGTYQGIRITVDEEAVTGKPEAKAFPFLFAHAKEKVPPFS